MLIPLLAVQAICFLLFLSPNYSRKEKLFRAVWFKLSSFPLSFLVAPVVTTSLCQVIGIPSGGAGILPAVLVFLTLWLPAVIMEIGLLRYASPKQGYARRAFVRDCTVIVLTNALMTLSVSAFALGDWGSVMRSAQKIYDSIHVGHTNEVEGLQFSVDNKTLASYSKDKTVKFWDVATGNQLRSKAIPYDASASLTQFTADLTMLGLQYGPNDEVQEFLLDSDAKPFQIPCGKQAWCYCPKSNLLASATDGRIDIWNAQGKKEGTIADHDANSLLFTDDGTCLVDCEKVDGYPQVNIFHVKSKSVLTTRIGKYPDLKYMSRLAGIDVDKKNVFLYNGDDVLSRLELASGQTTNVAVVPPPLILSSDCKQAIAWDNGGDDIQFYDISTGKKSLLIHKEDSQLEMIAISPDGHTLAAGSRTGAITLWDAQTGRLLRTIERPLLPGQDSHPD
ncbi:MAG: hypothetical protein U0105_09340 [Candidatus Obscuribacterales bacterium]